MFPSNKVLQFHPSCVHHCCSKHLFPPPRTRHRHWVLHCQVRPHIKSLICVFMDLLHSRAGTERCHPQHLPADMRAWSHPNNQGMLQFLHWYFVWYFLLLELKGKAQLLETSHPTTTPPPNLFFWQLPMLDPHIRYPDDLSLHNCIYSNVSPLAILWVDAWSGVHPVKRRWSLVHHPAL